MLQLCFRGFCRSECGAHLSRAHAPGDRRTRLEAVTGGRRSHGGAANTVVRATAPVHVPGSSALRHIAYTQLRGEWRSRRTQDGELVGQLDFRLIRLIFAPFISNCFPIRNATAAISHFVAICQLQEDQSIFRMRYLGEIEFGATVKNLTSEVGVSRSIFSNFPQQVKHDTAYERNCKSNHSSHNNIVRGSENTVSS